MKRPPYSTHKDLPLCDLVLNYLKRTNNYNTKIYPENGLPIRFPASQATRADSDQVNKIRFREVIHGIQRSQLVHK